MGSRAGRASCRSTMADNRECAEPVARTRRGRTAVGTSAARRPVAGARCSSLSVPAPVLGAAGSGTAHSCSYARRQKRAARCAPRGEASRRRTSRAARMVAADLGVECRVRRPRTGRRTAARCTRPAPAVEAADRRSSRAMAGRARHSLTDRTPSGSGTRQQLAGERRVAVDRARTAPSTVGRGRVACPRTSVGREGLADGDPQHSEARRYSLR
jgi:hypothetical protein